MTGVLWVGYRKRIDWFKGEKVFPGFKSSPDHHKNSKLDIVFPVFKLAGYYERLCSEWSALSPEGFAARKGAEKDGITSITAFGFVGGVISKRFVCLHYKCLERIIGKKKFSIRKENDRKLIDPIRRVDKLKKIPRISGTWEGHTGWRKMSSKEAKRVSESILGKTGLKLMVK